MSISLTLPLYVSDDENELVTQPTLSLIQTRNVEPAGYWYHLADATYHSILSGNYFGNQHEVTLSQTEENEREYFRGGASETKFVKLSGEDLNTDWYALLKLSAAETATENEIRSAYRRRCLETHPDKQTDHSDQEFKRVQRAFEILGCPTTRRAYDSSRPFDDSIPDEDVTVPDEDSFFKIFGPVFDRNRKWSLDPKIPKIGDVSTPLKDVNRFYDSWYRFNSWRDFSCVADIEEIDDSMCRDEKRYYQRENQRVLDRLKRAELKRIRSLVERAQKKDPRIRKVREMEAALKEKERLDRLAERERIRKDEIQRKAAVAEKERAEQQARAESIKAERNKIHECEVSLLSFFTSHNLIDNVHTNLIQTFAVRPPNISWLFSKITSGTEAEQVLAKVTAESVEVCTDKSVPAVLRFNELVVDKEQAIGMTRYGEPIKRISAEDLALRKKQEEEKKLAARKSATGVIWTDEDLVVLQKAIAKYPGGTVDRWRKMAQMLHDKFTEDEVLAKTKELEAQLRNKIQGTQSLSAAASSTANVVDAITDEWSVEQQKQLENGLRELKDYKEKDKFQKIAKFVSNKSAKQCFDRFKFLCSLNKKK